MLHNFVLHDGDHNNKAVGTFSYDSENKRFAMVIFDNIPTADLPLSLEVFVNKSKYALSHEDTMNWIRGRICPPGRHNIRDILRDNGLNEYDEFGLLMVTGARCDKDALFLQNAE